MRETRRSLGTSRRYGMRFERHHVERLCVVGTPEECCARLAAYDEVGADHVSLNPAVDEHGFLDQVERLRALVPGGGRAPTLTDRSRRTATRGGQP